MSPALVGRNFSSVDILLTFTLCQCSVMTLLNNLSGTGAWPNVNVDESRPWHRLLKNTVCRAFIDAEIISHSSGTTSPIELRIGCPMGRFVGRNASFKERRAGVSGCKRMRWPIQVRRLRLMTLHQGSALVIS